MNNQKRVEKKRTIQTTLQTISQRKENTFNNHFVSIYIPKQISNKNNLIPKNKNPYKLKHDNIRDVFKHEISCRKEFQKRANIYLHPSYPLSK